MDNSLYDMIFKRKSFHLFRNIGNEKLTDEDLKGIEDAFDKFVPLVPDIKVKIKLVKEGAACSRGQEYCIYMYSEKKDNYLQNIGYIGEQLDLYLVSRNIGTLWFGIGKPADNTLDGLDYVIMIAIAKVDSDTKFRKDMYKSKRKEVSEFWSGSEMPAISNIVRFTPSACNSQPWRVQASNSLIEISRYRKPGKIGIMPADKACYFNQIDMGIFLCFMDLCLDHEDIKYERTMFKEEDEKGSLNKTAEYRLC